MGGNLSCIGFTFAAEVHEEAFVGAVERMVLEATERLVCEAGEIAIWRSRTGAEVWLHLAPQDGGGDEREVVGLTPFFEGHSEVMVRLTDRISRPGDTAFEGAWSAWIASDESDSGVYPVIVDAVDWAASGELCLPCNVPLRVVCFAHELQAFSSEAAFAQAPGHDINLAPQAFIPIGLFSAAETAAQDGEAGDDEALPPPSSTALFTGRVVEHTRLVNEMMGLPFEWLLVESLEATYDVVVDPENVTGEIAVGATVQVAGWMVCRMAE